MGKRMGIVIISFPDDPKAHEKMRQMIRSRVEEVLGPSLTLDEVIEAIKNDSMLPEQTRSILSNKEGTVKNLVWYKIVSQPSEKCPLRGDSLIAVINPSLEELCHVGYLSTDKPGVVSLTYVARTDIARK